MNKVLVIGAGSIGKRHIRVLLELGEKNIAILRSGKGNALLKDIYDKCTVFFNEKEAFSWGPTHILICNPTSLHEYFIEASVQHKIPYFVEKPISDNFYTIDKLRKKLNAECFNNGIVGYVLRFNDLFLHLKKIIKDQVYGEVITASIKVGQYLPNWHPDEDYRKAYFSRKDLGGGVLRTLSHEIDIVQFLFGKIRRVFAKVSKLSKLEIDVDDVTDLLLATDLCDQIHINLNYLEPLTLRTGEIYFDQGKLSYNANIGLVKFTSNDSCTETIMDSKLEYNKQFKRQMISFLKDKDKDIACSIMEGLDVQKVIHISEESSNKGLEICID